MNSPDLHGAFVQLEGQIREINRHKSIFEDEIEVLKNEELVVIRVGFENERQKAAGLHHKKNEVDQILKEMVDLKRNLITRLASFEKNKGSLMVQITNLREKDEQIKCELKKHQIDFKNSQGLFVCMKEEFKHEYDALDKTSKELNEKRINADQLFNTMGNEFLELKRNQKEVKNEITIAEMKTKDLNEQIQKEKSTEELILNHIQKEEDEHRQKVQNNGKKYEDNEKEVNDEWSELDADLATASRKFRLLKLNEELAFANEELGVLAKEQAKINEIEVCEMKEGQEAQDDIKTIEDEIKEVENEVEFKEKELETEKLAHEKEKEECRRIQSRLEFLKENEMELENLLKEEELILKSGIEIESSVNNIKSEGHVLFFDKLTIESSLRTSMDSVLDLKNQLKMVNLEMEYLRNCENKMKEELEKMQTEINIKMKSIMGFFEKIKPDEPEKQLGNTGNLSDNIGKNDTVDAFNNERLSSSAEQSQTRQPLIGVSKPVAQTKSLNNYEMINETDIGEKDKCFDEKPSSPKAKPSEEDIFSKEKTNQRKADENRYSQESEKTENIKFFRTTPTKPQPSKSKKIEKPFDKLNKDTWNIEGKLSSYAALPLILSSTSTSLTLPSSDINRKLNLGMERVLNWNVKAPSDKTKTENTWISGSGHSVAPLKGIIKKGQQDQENKGKKVVRFNSYVKVKVFGESPCPSIPGDFTSDSESDSDYEPAIKKRASTSSVGKTFLVQDLKYLF